MKGKEQGSQLGDTRHGHKTLAGRTKTKSILKIHVGHTQSTLNAHHNIMERSFTAAFDSGAQLDAREGLRDGRRVLVVGCSNRDARGDLAAENWPDSDRPLGSDDGERGTCSTSRQWQSSGFSRAGNQLLRRRPE